MANFGTVFRFQSDKVIANQPKPKFHISIELSEGYFLFVSPNAFEGAMAIDRSDWPEMPKTESFVSFTSLIQYSKADLEDIKIQQYGSISKECIDKIKAHALDSLVLEQWEINLIVTTIDSIE